MGSDGDVVASCFLTWRRLREARARVVGLLELYELVATRLGVTADALAPELRRELAELAMPVIMPGWALTGTAPSRPEPIEVVDYDPQWPGRFQEWHDRLSAALGPVARRIDHVGSTSIPGLAAKPIIDVQVSVADVDAEQDYVGAICALGLQLRARDEVHRFFRPPPDRPRDLHVHVCAAGSEWEAEHLLFRDHLRAHAAARAAYVAAKRAAAARWRDDRVAYTEAKTAVIQRLLAEARATAGGPAQTK